MEDLNEVWMVVVRYRDGGTFSATNGYHEILSVHDNEKDADELHQRFKKEGFLPAGKYASWNGWFARLQDSYVERLKVIQE